MPRATKPSGKFLRTHCQFQTKFVPQEPTRDGTRLAKMGKIGLLRQFFTAKTLQDDLGPQNLLESFLGLIISSKPNLCLKGLLGMAQGMPKCVTKFCLRQFFTVAKQQDDLGPQNLLESFFGLLVSIKPEICAFCAD